ncbi:MAG: kelch repeat-containing protein, partial [Bacteroidota bacterium]
MKSKILLSCCMFFLSICILKAQDLQWKHFGNLLKARHYNNALYLGNNEILVSGGYINSKGTFIVNWSDAHLTGPPTRSCEIISLKDKTTRLTDSMSFARAEFPMLMTKDSNVVAISGINKEGATGELTPTVELYDRTTKRWEVIGNLIVPRRQHAAVFINDEEIIITGGRNQDVSAISAAEIFNVTTGKSRLIAKFPAAYSGMIAQIASDGSIL